MDNNLLPPQALELEEAVIGACLVDSKRCLDDVMNIITSEHFYADKNRIVFEAITALKNAKTPVDIMTVTDKLKSLGQLEAVGGAVYLSQATIKVGSGMHAEHHARIIYEKYVRRECIRIASQLTKYAYADDEISEYTAKIQDEILRLQKVDTGNISTLSDAINDVYNTIDFNLTEERGLTGIGTGLQKFDSFSGGLHKTDLVVVAGETSQGKTALALTMINNAVCMFDAKVAFYSLEMSKQQLTARLLAQKSNVSGKDILLRKLEDYQIKRIDKAVGELYNRNIFFDDSSTSRIDTLIRSIRMMKIKYDIDIAVVDYLQLVSSNMKGNKEQQTADIARSLKNLAKELNICILLLSQLRRSENPYPTLNRLRDSGQIEEAADVIIFVYRPEYYRRNYPDEFSEYPVENTALIDIAKGRNIGTFQFITSFKKHITLFHDYDGELFEKIKTNNLF